MGRIRRIGVDTVTNYSFQETSAYDANDPAGTVGAWPDDAAMDQDPRQASPSEVTAEGVLITFERFPDAFNGAQVKVQPTYDFDAGEDPYLEMWLHSSDTGDWTKRSSIQFANVFVGAKTGVRKIFDLTFFPFERDIDQVWLTMNPGAVGTPSMDFAMIRLFGQCENTLPKGGDDTDPCADKNAPFYDGKDALGNPCPGTTFGPPPTNNIPTLDLCNPASIAQYREAVKDIPGFVEMFDAWYDSNIEAIQLYCAGTNPDPPTGQPQPPHPAVLPPLDLCDPVSIDAFRGALGTPEQVASFDAFIDGLEADGFFEFTCPPALPPEVYIDPVTLEPAAEPDPVERPFGQGPGGVPTPGADQPTDSTPPKHIDTGSGDPIEYVAFFFSGGSPAGAGAVEPGGTYQSFFASRLAELDDAETTTSYAKALTANTIFTEFDAGTKSGLRFDFSGALPGTVVNVRVVTYTIGGSILGTSQFIARLISMDGDGFVAGRVNSIDIGGGVFATQNPVSGENYFRLNRPADLTGFVNFLKLAAPNTSNFGGTGSGLNWGCGFLVRIIATPPGANAAVTVVGSFY